MSQRNPPTGDERLARILRSLTGRVTRLEKRPDGRANASHDLPVKFGNWVLSEDPDTGDLLATSTMTGEVTVLASP